MTYGYCPTCQAPGVSRERSPTGKTCCVNGHRHPHAEFKGAESAKPLTDVPAPRRWRPGWIGVDFDGTLVHHPEDGGVGNIGEPIPKMVERVRAWIAEGMEVRIVTARVSGTDEYGFVRTQRMMIQKFLNSLGLPTLPVTCEKDYDMIELWDDRAVQVIPNTGERADGKD